MKIYSISKAYSCLCLIIFVVSIIIGCAPISQNTKPATLESPIIASPIPIVSPSATPTLTPITTETPTPDFTTKLNQACVDLLPEIETQISGKALIFDSMHPGLPNNLSVIDLDNKKTRLIAKVYDSISISPKQDELAYVNEYHNLIILDSSLRKIKQFNGTKHWWGVIDWMDEQRLIIQNMPLKNGFIKPPASTLLFNLENQETTDYLPNYPEIDILVSGVSNWGNEAFTVTVYNKSLSRVVYPASNNDDDTPLVLWDTENREEILRLHGNDVDYGGGPEWLRDGSSFIVAVFPSYTSWRGKVYRNFNDEIPYMGGFELAQISFDGKVKRLTYLTKDYVFGAEGISLSNDNTKVAFWLNLNYKSGDMDADRQLAVLDIRSGEITNTCLQGGDFPYPPIWSADDNSLLVTVSNIRKNENKVLIVDIDRQQATILTENAIAAGWLEK